jgi:hypothetical protein
VNGKAVHLAEIFLDKAEKQGIRKTQRWYTANYAVKAAGGMSLSHLTKLFHCKRALEMEEEMNQEVPYFHSWKQFNAPARLLSWDQPPHNNQPAVLMVGYPQRGRPA